MQWEGKGKGYPMKCHGINIKCSLSGLIGNRQTSLAAMASTTPTSTPLSLSSSALVNAKAPSRLQPPTPAAAPLPPPPPAAAAAYLSKTNAYCRKIARNVVAMATGEAPAEVVATAETPEIIKTIQEAWDKVEDKYAVSSLAVAGGVALWASAGMISAIDRLPLVPGVMEIVGIGYTGWFAYRNLVFKPDREALIQKIKSTYNDIIGSS
ncbi:protein CURVATURE THYLAKOID 1B, chloroplastic [Sesamum alatum]|uniref:Protein CURVATURE THYLAKOID 1B, chloroplastic n=1 Tax=Sesamum alatum TaxID=300844 RepID=A0AAE2CDV0_9LAMI|nr:protein CURVATURE THYLAKOID 1B, chloroplastic [Sesamum alatum]